MDSGEEKSLPEGTGEFLDTWLFLLEKLVNPKTMFESPHSLPSKLGFCPLKFLIQIHKVGLLVGFWGCGWISKEESVRRGGVRDCLRGKGLSERQADKIVNASIVFFLREGWACIWYLERRHATGHSVPHYEYMTPYWEGIVYEVRIFYLGHGRFCCFFSSTLEFGTWQPYFLWEKRGDNSMCRFVEVKSEVK